MGETAGIDTLVKVDFDGMQFRFHGFNHKLEKFVSKWTSSLSFMIIDPKTLRVVIEEFKNKIRNGDLRQPVEVVSCCLSLKQG